MSVCVSDCQCARNANVLEMEASKRGHLGQETVADLIRGAAELRLSGLLRLTANKQIKVIFFESGRPVFAISSQPSDQPERRFVEEGLATIEQIQQAKSINASPNELGLTLAKIGAAPLQAVETTLKDLAFKIILSTFEWTEGEYFFDTRSSPVHQIVINYTAEDCIVGGSRRVSLIEDILNLSAPGNKTVGPAGEDEARFGSGASLNSTEGYVLSCISGPTRIKNIAALTGLSDVETRKAVHVLLSLGLIKAIEQESSNSSRSAAAPVEPIRVVPTDELGEVEFTESGFADNPFLIENRPSDTFRQAPLSDLENILHFSGWQESPSEGHSVSSPEECILVLPVSSSSGSEDGAADHKADFGTSSHSTGGPAKTVNASNDAPLSHTEQLIWAEPHAGQESSGQLSDPGIQDEVPFFSPESLDQVLSKLENRLEKLDSSNLYQILGVTRLASKATIQGAYEGLIRAYNTYGSEWPGHEELISKVASLQSLADKAYEILSDPEKRRIYDIPKSTPMPSHPIIERGGPESTARPAPRSEINIPVRKPLPIEIPKSVVRPDHPPQAPPTPATTYGQKPGLDYTGSGSTSDAADHFYRQGRAYYDRHDFHTAAHMLRQAVNLDSTRASYHYHLGLTLAVLSQARTVHKHDGGCHVTCKMGGGLVRNQRVRHEAEQHLLKAAEIEPSSAEIKLKLAQLYKEAGMEKKAEQYFHEVLLLNPRSKIAQKELGLFDSELDVDPVTGRRPRKQSS
jgi:tetratricopeptide (TPR) repeat protein